jgi:chaperone required for assembly of F1-ATPase
LDLPIAFRSPSPGASFRLKASGAAHVDNFKMERWGVDEEATARREACWREMEAAQVVLAASRRAPRG